MKVHMLIGTNFEAFGLDFTAAVKGKNALFGISLDYLIRPDAVGNYNAAWTTLE